MSEVWTMFVEWRPHRVCQLWSPRRSYITSLRMRPSPHPTNNNPPRTTTPNIVTPIWRTLALHLNAEFYLHLDVNGITIDSSSLCG